MTKVQNFTNQTNVYRSTADLRRLGGDKDLRTVNLEEEEKEQPTNTNNNVPKLQTKTK